MHSYSCVNYIDMRCLPACLPASCEAGVSALNLPIFWGCLMPKTARPKDMMDFTKAMEINSTSGFLALLARGATAPKSESIA